MAKITNKIKDEDVRSLRFPKDLRIFLTNQAKKNGRTFIKECIIRLQISKGAEL